MGDLPQRVRPDPDGRYTVDVHVTPDGRARIGDHTYTPEEFADILRRNGDYDGRPIRLIGCDAGSNDFAPRLSRELDTPVLAPNKPAWSDSSGRVFSSDYEVGPDGKPQPKIPPNGQWDTHHPDGSTSRASEDGFTPDTADADKQDLAPDDAKDRGDDDTSTNDTPDDDTSADDPHRPPTAIEPTEHQLDPNTVDTADPGETPSTTDSGPPDKSRGAIVDEFGKDDPRVTKRNPETGLIEEIENRPVKDYIEDLGRQRAENNIAPATHRRHDGPCSALAIDLRTGVVTEGVNGRKTDLLDVEDLHPLLLENYSNLANWRHGVEDAPGHFKPNPYDNNNPAILDGKAHHDDPLRHAEVKAVNELLWERQRRVGLDNPLSPEVLEELRFDPHWVKDGQGAHGDPMRIGGQAGACANCDNILRGVPSYAGRYSYHPDDYRFELHSKAQR